MIKEDFLKFRDAFFAFGHSARVKKLKIGECVFHGADVSSLIREEIEGQEYFSSAFLAFVNMRLPLRLRQKGIKIDHLIEWYENQSGDKGLIKGFKRHYPETPIRGYQGYIVMPEYLCSFPTTMENKLGFLPHETAVIGCGLERRIKEFCPELKIVTAPAFRFSGVWNERKHWPEKGVFTVLAAMPIMQAEGLLMLKTLADLIKKASGQTFRAVIKHHPDFHLRDLERMYGKELLSKFETTKDNLTDAIEKSDLMISSASSSCLHAIGAGTPVIIAASQNGLAYNPIPENAPRELWKICCSASEIAEAIQFFKEQSEKTAANRIKLAEQVRRDFLICPNQENVKEFLSLK